MSAGVVTLGQIAGRLPVLDIACNRCDRRVRLHMDRLIAEDGPDLPIPMLLRPPRQTAPGMIKARAHDVCGVHAPGLSRVVLGVQ